MEFATRLIMIMSWHDGGKKKKKGELIGYATKRRVSKKTSAELYKFSDTVYQASDKKKKLVLLVMVRLSVCEAMSERGKDEALRDLLVCWLAGLEKRGN